MTLLLKVAKKQTENLKALKAFPIKGYGTLLFGSLTNPYVWHADVGRQVPQTTSDLILNGRLLRLPTRFVSPDDYCREYMIRRGNTEIGTS